MRKRRSGTAADAIKDYARAVVGHGPGSDQTQAIRDGDEDDLEELFEIMDDVAGALTPKARKVSKLLDLARALGYDV